MAKIRIYSKKCFALGPGAMRGTTDVVSVMTVPGAWQDIDEALKEDPTFKLALKAGDIVIAEHQPMVVVDTHFEDVTDDDEDTEVDPVTEYMEKVKLMNASEVKEACEEYGAEFREDDKLKENKKRLMAAYKLHIKDAE